MLSGTVVPTLEYAQSLAGTPTERLHALALYDCLQLLSGRWNLGRLYHLPELDQPRFAEFIAKRRELFGLYESLSAAVLGDGADPRRHLPARLVESVIGMRSDNADVEGIAPVIADSALAVLTYRAPSGRNPRHIGPAT
ncbi:hypothetical protein [Tsukamurella soli]|uniref:hypothetical protein n=1 Tax=Tsukamurella soli TaxID=644556 RepID=UPI00360FD242